MIKKLFFLAISNLIAIAVFSQQLPLNTCGILYDYDNAGNRIKKRYYCYNGGTYGGRPAKNEVATKEDTSIEFQQVDALYPNPTTGKFSITFSKALESAVILVTDLSGKKMLQYKASGNKVDFDLSSLAAGAYFVRVEEKGNVIVKKVIKQ